MQNIQLIWMLASYQTLKLIQLANMFWHLDVELVDLFVVLVYLHVPLLKSDVKLNVSLSKVFWIWLVIWLVITSHLPDPAHMLQSQMVWLMPKKKHSDLVETYSRYPHLIYFCILLFIQEPDSTLLLSSGCGRHWPDARGIFHNNDENLFVWVNEEDHMRIVSMEKGDNVKRIIERFAKATSTIQQCLKKEGYDFMHSEHLGWILTCPSNLGTGLRAGAMVKVSMI